MFRSDQWGTVPGFTAASETYENAFRFGQSGLGLIIGAQISGAARDATGTPTTVLRPGLLLGQIAASGLLTAYAAANTDGSSRVHSILLSGFRMQDLDATNRNVFPYVLAAGPVQASKLIGLDNNARAQMRGRFIFDDEVGTGAGSGGITGETAKTTSYTVTAADVGTLFTTTGASGTVIFTLPALAAGLGPFEFLNTVDQTMTITAPAGKLITFNNAAATSATYSTASNKIGARAQFQVNAAGTFYTMRNFSPGNTLTVA